MFDLSKMTLAEIARLDSKGDLKVQTRVRAGVTPPTTVGPPPKPPRILK